MVLISVPVPIFLFERRVTACASGKFSSADLQNFLTLSSSRTSHNTEFNADFELYEREKRKI